MPPVIAGEGFRLVPWRVEHFARFAALQGDALSMQAMAQQAQDRAAAWRELAAFAGHWVLKGFGFYALEAPEADGFCGYVGLWQPIGWPEPELTYALLPAARGRGLATRTSAAVLTAAGEAGFDPLVSYLDPHNDASRRVMERLGATTERQLTIWGHDFEVWRHAARPARRTA